MINNIAQRYCTGHLQSIAFFVDKHLTMEKKNMKHHNNIEWAE